MNDKEWGTPVSKDKIIYRRNRLIEYQKTNQARFTPLYEIIDENILDINYMIYEIDKLQSNWNSLRDWLNTENCKYHYGIRSGKTLLYGKFLGRVDVLDKMNELESSDSK